MTAYAGNGALIARYNENAEDFVLSSITNYTTDNNTTLGSADKFESAQKCVDIRSFDPDNREKFNDLFYKIYKWLWSFDEGTIPYTVNILISPTYNGTDGIWILLDDDAKIAVKLGDTYQCMAYVRSLNFWITPRSDSLNPWTSSRKNRLRTFAYGAGNKINTIDDFIAQAKTESKYGGYMLQSGSNSLLPVPSQDYNVDFGIYQPGYINEEGENKFRQLLDNNPDLVSNGGKSDNNPYKPGGNSGTGGGGGNFDGSSDKIDFPDLPSLSALSSGAISMYKMDAADIQLFMQKLYDRGDFLDQVKKILSNDPMDAIISLQISPIAPTDTADAEIKLTGESTGITAKKVSNQYMIYDFGTKQISQFYGSCLDYSPFTKFYIYLPFIGVRTLETDMISGQTIALRYYFDLLTGTIVAMLKNNNDVLYQWSGNASMQVPITGRNWTDLLKSQTQMIIGAAATVAGGATGGAAGAAIGASLSGVASTTAQNIMNSKPGLEVSGNVSMNAGFLSIKTPFIFAEIPRQSMPQGLNSFIGYPSNITETLGNITGYTQVDSIHLEGIPATEEELQEIEDELKKGVIL
jgi:hypothetical protein